MELYKSKNTVSVLNNPLWPKVSICIIVKNELENLRVLLPLLVSQSYDGEYDIHIVDDHSTDGTLHWLTAYKAEHEILVHAHASEVTSLNGKKHALSYALTLTMHDILLMTDADCRPNSSHWISSMVDELGKNEDLVLGYSPYLTLPGTLNQLIQLETTFTAWLYLGMTLNRSAFMGVGRNILYRTSILKKSNNLLKYKNVLSGDDDLTINELGRNHKAAIQFSQESWMISIPKTTWRSWIKQKSRHVSTAKYYNFSDQIMLLLFYSSLILTWVIPISLIWISPWMGVFFIGLKWIYFFSFKRLSIKIFHQQWIFCNWLCTEAVYVLSLLYLSPATIIKNPSNW